MTDITIRLFQPNDFAEWLPLWAAYLHADEDAAKMKTVFDFLIDPSNQTEGYAAVKDGKFVGFAHIIHHPSTYQQTRAVAFMEDLMVHTDYRGQSIGKTLIDFGIARAKDRQCARFFWFTDEKNAPAQRLYGRYVEGENWIRYAVEL